MKTKIKPFGLLVGIIVTAILFIAMQFIQQGLFASATVTEKDFGPYVLVYKKHIGEYKNVGPLMDSIYNDLKDNHAITTTKGFGIYYDDPKKVSKEQLRSIIGCIVETKTIAELEALNNAYGVSMYPKSKSVVAEFPYKGKLSIIIGIYKAYPKLSSYIAKNKYSLTPIMELYDLPNKKIEYIASPNLELQLFYSLLDQEL